MTASKLNVKIVTLAQANVMRNNPKMQVLNPEAIFISAYRGEALFQVDGVGQIFVVRARYMLSTHAEVFAQCGIAE